MLALRVFVALVAASLAAGLSACGGSSGQSTGNAAKNASSNPKSYCVAFYSRAAPLEEKYSQADAAGKADPLGSLTTLLSSPGDLAVVFDSMIPVAPADIKPETVAVRDAFKKLQDNPAASASNPASAVASNLLSALTSSGSFQRVGAYLQSHCPLSSAVAQKYVKQPVSVSSNGTSSTPITSAPAIGSQLAAVTGSGRYNVITNGKGFSIIDSLTDISTNTDESTVTTYDAAGTKLAEIPAGALTGECGASDVEVPGAGRVILGELVSTTPAQGITAASTSTKLNAWSAGTGQPLWSANVYAGDPGCNSDGQTTNGNLQSFSNTYNGLWGVAGAIGGGGYVVNLKSGAVQRDADTIGTLGNYVVDDPRHDPGNDNAVYRLVDPATGVVVGKILSDANAPNGIGLGTHGDLAPSGLFPSDSASSTAPAGTSSDGLRLLAAAQNANKQGLYAVTGYGLPAMHALWTKSFDQPGLIGDGGGVLLVEVQNCNGGAVCLVGLNDATGAKMWQIINYNSICGLTNSQMLVSTNDQTQFAVIDLKTGRQISYSSSGGADCPTVLSGGIGVALGSGDPTEPQQATVTQLLEP